MTHRYDTVVAGYRQEWSAFDRACAKAEGLERSLAAYFAILPWAKLPALASDFDLGFGRGHWARLVEPKVGELRCINTGQEALAVARNNLQRISQIRFHLPSVKAIPFLDDSMNVGYSLGVPHHVPDTAAGLAAGVRKLRRGAQFLVHFSCAFVNRPAWFGAIWKVCDLARRLICCLPFGLKWVVWDILAVTVDWLLARIALVGGESIGLNVDNWPISGHRRSLFYVMGNDSLDRFGARLKQCFTQLEIESTMRHAWFGQIHFSEVDPFWCASGNKL
jgi:SAM-dependent methyltransferase